MEYQGVVIRLVKDKAIVITRDFQCFFIKRDPTNYVGEQVEFTEKYIIKIGKKAQFTKRYIIKNRSIISKMGLAAACIVILFAVVTYILNFTGLTNKGEINIQSKILAYIDIDINPSLEIEIDDMGKVLKLVPLNKDAEELVEKLQPGSINISKAMNVIIDELKKNKVISEYGKDYILVASTLNNKKSESDKEYQIKKKKLDNLINSLKDDIQNKENGKVNVFLIQTSLDERKVAQKEGISTGRYALFNKYKNMSNGFSIEDAKKIQINELIEGQLTNGTENDDNKADKTMIPESLPTSTPTPLNPKDTTKISFTTPSSKYGDSSQTPGKEIQVSNGGNVAENTPTGEVIIQLNTPSPSPVPTDQPINSSLVSIESYNSPGYFIQQRFFVGLILKDTIMKEDTIYKMVPGLADPSCVSFESVNFPGHYIMHDDFKIYMKTPDGSVNFNERATFRKVPGLADENLTSFQSFNYPDKYIRHLNSNLQLDEIKTDMEKEDATFILKIAN